MYTVSLCVGMNSWLIALLSLKELDIVTLKELSTKLNVIPVIAKADTLTREERTTFKEAVN